MSKISRNDPCPCGSGKKYKKCCLNKQSSVIDLTWQKMRQTEGKLIPALLDYIANQYRETVVEEAWTEFFLEEETEYQLPANPPIEYETIFLPWFLFNWIDDGYFDIDRHDLQDEPVALLYLKEKQHKLDPFEKRFIQAACAEYFSFYMVTHAVPGKRLDLKEVFLQRAVSVHERTGSESLQAGDIVFARVVTMDNNSIMLGCAPYIIPTSYLSYFIDLREYWESAIKKFGTEFLFEYDIEIREVYHEIVEQIKNPALPQLVNNDGDPIELTKLYYRLDCTVEEAFQALKTLAKSIDNDELYQQGEFDNQGVLRSIDIPWLEKPGNETSASQSTLKANLSVSEGKLTIDINSRERADAIKRKISRRLGKRAAFQTSVIQSVEKMLKDAQSQPAPPPTKAQLESKELQEQPEIQDMLKKMADEHWKDWLDSPLPALKNITPRKAAKTATGRERLEALFLEFESKIRQDESMPFNPDIDALRKALGMN